MDGKDLIFKVLDFLGWVWFFVKKPFKWFSKQSWKVKLFVVVFILLIFDSLRFWLFKFLIWLLI